MSYHFKLLREVANYLSLKIEFRDTKKDLAFYKELHEAADELEAKEIPILFAVQCSHKNQEFGKDADTGKPSAYCRDCGYYWFTDYKSQPAKERLEKIDLLSVQGNYRETVLANKINELIDKLNCLEDITQGNT